MKVSLLRRMILAQGLVIALVWAISTVIVLWTAYLSKSSRLDETLSVISASLAALLQDEHDPAHLVVQARRIQQLDQQFTKEEYLEPGEYRPMYQVLNASGQMAFRSDNAPAAPLTSLEPGIHKVMLGGEVYQVSVAEDPDRHVRALAAVPQSLIRRLAWRNVWYSPIQLVILFGVLALLTWLASRQALKPLRSLARAVAARGPWDLRPLEGHADLAETRPLIQALNRLFQRVGELLEHQRRFIADAAHELKTPLAALTAQAQALQHETDDARRTDLAQALQQEVERAAHLVGQLLTLARLDAANAAMAKAPLDLAALAQERVAALVPQAISRGQDLGFEGPASCPVVASRTALTLALDNLLLNALRSTPPAGRITLRLRGERGAILLEVEDTGPGIPAAFREAVFDRFCRMPVPTGPVPDGHVPDGHVPDEPHGGLGLAIVRKAVEWHGGTVALSDRPGGSGLVATMRLPEGL